MLVCQCRSLRASGPNAPSSRLSLLHTPTTAIRAVLSRGGQALNLTEDHKPNSPREMERIYRYGKRTVFSSVSSTYDSIRSSVVVVVVVVSTNCLPARYRRHQPKCRSVRTMRTSRPNFGAGRDTERVQALSLIFGYKSGAQSAACKRSRTWRLGGGPFHCGGPAHKRRERPAHSQREIEETSRNIGNTAFSSCCRAVNRIRKKLTRRPAAALW